jgi:ubiquinone/menaquinone biosynthesis C-methylase UbiE
MTREASSPYGRGVDPRSRRVAAVFDLASATYDDVGVTWFGPIASGLVDALAPAAGEVVLDMGCGKGAATLPIAERVGPQGRVLGLDASEGMLAQARTRAAEQGIDNIEWLLGDAMAPQLPPASVDAIAASLVLFFLPEPVTALRAWRELLRPDGRVGVTTFGRFDPAIDALGEVIDPHLPDDGLDPRAPAEDWFASDAGVERLLAAAGFREVVTSHLDVTVHLRDVQHWRTWSQSLGQRAAWERVPPDDLPALMDAAAAVFAAHAQPDGSLVAANDVRITLAHR